MLAHRLALFTCLALVAGTGTARAALDPHLPPDTESYLSVNVKQIAASPIAKKVGVEQLKGWFPVLSDIDGLVKAVGGDPSKDLDRAQIAGPRTSETDRGLVILTGRFDADKMKKTAQAEGWTVHKEKLGTAEHAVYELKPKGGGKSTYVAVSDNKTLLASGGKEYVVDALKAARSKKKPALKDTTVQAVIDKLDPRLGVTLAAKGGAFGQSDLLALLPKRIKDGLDKVEMVGGGIGFTHEVKIDLVGAAKSADDAQLVRDNLIQAARLLKAGVGFLGNDTKAIDLLADVVNTVKVGGKDRTITLSAKITADVIDEFRKDSD